MQGFQLWVQTEMMKKLNQTPALGFDDDSDVKVAVTTLAFKNSKIIQLLRKRGSLIQAEEWAKVDAVSDEINKLKNDPKEFEELTTPCSVFMSFESEEGYERAKELDTAIENDPNLEHLKYWLGNHTIEIQEASEPSDIIWENRQYTPW